MRTAKTQIRLGGCPGWSESSLGAQSHCKFCHVAADMCFQFSVIETSVLKFLSWTFFPPSLCSLSAILLLLCPSNSSSENTYFLALRNIYFHCIYYRLFPEIPIIMWWINTSKLQFSESVWHMTNVICLQMLKYRKYVGKEIYIIVCLAKKQ